MLTWYPSLFKLADEPQIIFKEQTQIVNAVFKHGNTFYAHAKGIAAGFFGVVAAHAQYVGVYHAAA